MITGLSSFTGRKDRQHIPPCLTHLCPAYSIEYVRPKFQFYFKKGSSKKKKNPNERRDYESVDEKNLS